MLTVIFLVWAAICLGFGGFLIKQAPAITLGMSGAVLGAMAGFLIANADGPAEVPAYAAVGASIGLAAIGLVGLVVAPARGASRALRRLGLTAILATPFAAATLTLLLQQACPLYVSGARSGYCNFEHVDLMGGWVSGVIVAFVVDALFVAGLLFVSSAQAAGAEEPSPVGGT